MLVIKIALRNILRHKGKSLVIGGILLIGALIMTLGISIIQGSKKGIEDNLVSRFTGNIILVSGEETKDNVLFTPMGKSLKVIKDYDNIDNMLKDQDYIESYIPMTRGVAFLFGFEVEFWGLFVLGTNFEDYQKTSY